MTTEPGPADSSPFVDISALVMTYNEVDSLAAFVGELDKTLQSLGRSYEVVVIDDGSTDGSAPLADRLAAQHDAVRVVRHAENRGLGGVYRTGFAEARGRFLTFYPADGQFPASIIETMLPLIDTHDLVLGYLPQRRGARMGSILSALERLSYRLLFGPMPRFQGIMMLRRELLDRFALVSDGRGWGVVMELIVRSARAGCSTTSVPTAIRMRRHGSSKVTNLRSIWSNLRQLARLRRAL